MLYMNWCFVFVFSLVWQKNTVRYVPFEFIGDRLPSIQLGDAFRSLQVGFDDPFAEEALEEIRTDR